MYELLLLIGFVVSALATVGLIIAIPFIASGLWL